MPNKTCKSLVREICVHGPELVALVQRHPQEANQLSLGIEIAPRPMRNVVGQDHLLARQLATTGVEPEEHGLPPVTVPVYIVVHVPLKIPSKDTGTLFSQGLG